ncbi:MAG: tectonin domain-containing protein [Candidatus Babeliales bacterium]
MKNFLKISYCLLLFVFLTTSIQKNLWAEAIKYKETILLQASPDGRNAQITLSAADKRAQIKLASVIDDSTKLQLIKADNVNSTEEIKYGDIVLIKPILAGWEDSYFKAAGGWQTWTIPGEVSKNFDMNRFKWRIVSNKNYSPENKAGQVVNSGDVVYLRCLEQYFGREMHLCWFKNMGILGHTTDTANDNNQCDWKIIKVQPAPVPAPVPTPTPTPSPAPVPVQPGVVAVKMSQPDKWQELSELNKSIMTFEVKAPHDAIILLAAEKFGSLTAGANVYELIIGGWNNTSSTIRKKWQDNNTNQGVAGGSQLDSNNLVKFWISYNNGEIKIGKGEVGQNIISQWTDPNPYPNIKYFSLTNWDVPVEYKNLQILPFKTLPAPVLKIPKDFDLLEGNFIKVALGIGDNGQTDIWAINQKNDVFQGKITQSEEGIGMGVVKKSKVSWTRKSGNGLDVKVGSDGTVCTLSSAGDAFEVIDGSWNRLGSEKFSQISVGNKDNIWALKDFDKKLFKFNRNSGQWEEKATGYISVSVGNDGVVWAIDEKEGRAFRLQSGSDKWEASPGYGFTKILCVDQNSVLVLSKDKQVWINEKPTAIFENNYIKDSWSKISDLVCEDFAFNGLGDIAILTGQKTVDGFPLYFKKGTGSPVIPIKEVIAPDKNPVEVLEMAKAKPEAEKLDFYQKVVDWAKDNKKKFDSSEQQSFVWNHLFPLYSSKKDLPKENTDLAKLLKILQEAKDYEPMVGAYAYIVQSVMIDRLKEKGVTPVKTIIPETARFEDLLKNAEQKKGLSEKIVYYNNIVSWAKAFNKKFTPEEQNVFVWSHLYPLYLNVDKETDANKKKTLQQNLLQLLVNAKDYESLVGIFRIALESSMIQPLKNAGVTLPGKPSPSPAPTPTPAPTPVPTPERGRRRSEPTPTPTPRRVPRRR